MPYVGVSFGGMVCRPMLCELCEKHVRRSQVVLLLLPWWTRCAVPAMISWLENGSRRHGRTMNERHAKQKREDETLH
jgi:hypothetical protein